MYGRFAYEYEGIEEDGEVGGRSVEGEVETVVEEDDDDSEIGDAAEISSTGDSGRTGWDERRNACQSCGCVVRSKAVTIM